MEYQKDKKDVSTHTNYRDVVSLHLTWNVEVDFNNKCIIGECNYTMKVVTFGLKEIILDDMDLEIFEAFVNDEPVKHKHGVITVIGRPLIFEVSNELKIGEEFQLRIKYKSSDKAYAINFLEPEQTLSKSHPYMYTQSEPIYCRSFLPCQDTPSVKFSVECHVTTPKGIVGLFSGLHQKQLTEYYENKEVNVFKQPIPIPSYLIALCCGNLKMAQISNRVNVWSEPEMLQKSVKEFEDTEAFIAIAENYAGIPYKYTTFDILVLPPSFPYGGMENPNLTFLNPSVVCGDKSAVHVLAHELAHSWTGNLVTNSDWTNFFVNEGFTVFLERKIIEAYYGKDEAILASLVGLNNLKKTIDSIGHDQSFTSLHPNLENVNPDDCFSLVPYEKGYTLLKYLESLLGEELFKSIFQEYIFKFEGKSTNFEDGFMKIYISRVSEIENGPTILANIDWIGWTQKSGSLITEFKYEVLKSKEISKSIGQIEKGDYEGFPELWLSLNTNLKIMFLQSLSTKSDKIQPNFYDLLRNIWENDTIYNNDLVVEFYLLTLKLNRQDYNKKIIEFLGSQGRMKYVKVLFERLHSISPESAIKVFNEVKSFYHVILRGILERKFNIS